MTQTNTAANLSFPQAIADTNDLITKIANNQINETEVAGQVAYFTSTIKGARGFFVAYLTSESSVSDNPSTGVIKGLESSTEIASDLLVKNLAMCTGMELFHRRNGDLKMAASSKQIQRRTIKLIDKFNSDLVTEKLRQLAATLEQQSDIYQGFLDSQKYDEGQKEQIKKVISLQLN